MRVFQYLVFLSIIYLSSCGSSKNEQATKYITANDTAPKQDQTTENNNSSKKATPAPEGFQLVEVASLYAMHVADYMNQRNDLNDVASLQYANGEKELYLVVIEENKEKELDSNYDLQSYYAYVAQNLSANQLDSKQVTPPKSLKINNKESLQWEITGLFGEVSVFYIITVIETEKYFYQILMWTMEQNRQQYYKDMQQMIQSFQELI